ncbi:MAG: 4Fe-4S dicluster domain-containing protein [Thermoleophilia bacterium]|nr:4Fe-4S dicluster domain-containing protein [Thermoleophilia bacterium]
MKGLVVYYSATGSTRKVARAICRGMQQVIDADVASVAEISPEEVANYDLIGIGSPIWFFRETANVRLFMYQLPSLAGKLGFVFCTHGTAPLGIFHSMVPLLRRKGLTIIGWRDWYGSVYQVLHAPKPYFTDGHPDATDLAEAEAFGRAMAERAVNIAAGQTDLIPELPSGPDCELTFQPHPIGEPFPGANPKRRVDLETCKYPDCTLCEDICPTHCIQLMDDPPSFGPECYNCSLCNRLCPTGAIKLEGEAAKRMQPEKRINMEKCRYPDCKLCVTYCPMNCIDFSQNPPTFTHACEGDDLCWVICPQGAIEITNLDVTHAKMWEGFQEARVDPQNHPFLEMLREAEAKGKFRRLVPLEEIGWDNPVFKIQRTPRFDIHELLEE